MGWSHKWYLANKERIAAKNRARYAANRQSECDRSRAWRKANPSKVKVQKRRYTLKYKEKELGRIIAWKRADPERHRETTNARVRRLKEEFIHAMGGHCQCCGEDMFEFLSADHVKGRSPEEKREFGQQVYLRAKREGYPRDRYALLCMNCNFAKGKYGMCPHQKVLTKLVASTTR